MIKFPSKFFWGAATSSYQVEGNNTQVDWWAWEKEAGKEQSGQACRHYELYEADFDLAKSLHHNAHRLSIEWARIEPEPGRYDAQELQHYVNVLIALRKRGIEPMVTLHHFTNPQWLAKIGGWENPKVIEHFLDYCDHTVRALAKHVDYWITINEPTIISSHAYLFGVWPPQGKSIWRTMKVQKHQIQAHIKTYQRIHQIYEESNLKDPKVGIAHHMPALVACQDTLRNRLAVKLRDKSFNFWFLDSINSQKTMDFIGLNYYSRQLVETKSWWIVNMLSDVCNQGHHPVKKNALGWDIYPKGLYELLIKLKKYHLPIMITENGICVQNDEERWEFIQEHLKAIHQAIQEGVDVQGYMYWSLLDNFEWDKGFAPRFGLIEVDYQSFKRTPRASAIKYANVCQSGTL